MTQTPVCRNLVPFHFAFGVRISGGLVTYNRLKKKFKPTHSFEILSATRVITTDEKRIKPLAGMTRCGKNESRDAAPHA